MAANTEELGKSLGETIVFLLRVIFSLTFPILLITLCGVSYVLTFWLHLPEFSLWPVLAMLAVDYAKSNLWAAIALGAFCLVSLPLAWVAFREQETRVSSTILRWVIAAIVIGAMCWLRTVWPYDGNGWQILAYGFILFGAWSAVIEAMIGTVRIVVHIRRNRPRPARPPRQEPHGAREPRGRTNEPETI